MVALTLFLAIATPADNAGPTANDLFALIERQQISFAMSLEEGAFPDTSLNIKKIQSYRCKTAVSGRYRCTVQYRGLNSRKVKLRLLVEKTGTIWTEVLS